MTQKEEIPQTEPSEIEQLIEQVKQSNLEQSAVDKLERLLRLILRLVELLQHKNVSLKRLRTMVFGPRTEKRKTSDRHQEEEKKEETAGGVAGSEAKSEAGEKIETEEGAVEQRKPAGKGHGRRPAAAYRGAKIVECRHQQLKAGDQCPDPGCEGRLYQYYPPNNFIQFTGRPMLEVSQYKREVLRCAHCQRALKRFVLFRKNSLFFKTEHGADCGSIIMTLIESCRLNGRDPWAYLVILRKNAVAARKNPELFLPWDHAEAESEPRAA